MIGKFMYGYTLMSTGVPVTHIFETKEELTEHINKFVLNTNLANYDLRVFLTQG